MPSSRADATDTDTDTDATCCYLLSYGVNDCSARVGHIGLERVLGMLRYADGRVGGAR